MRQSLSAQGAARMSSSNFLSPPRRRVDPTHALLARLEFLFSASNLHKDAHLRGLLTGEGSVALSTLAGFTRIAAVLRECGLTGGASGVEALAHAARGSPLLRVSRDGARVALAAPYTMQPPDAYDDRTLYVEGIARNALTHDALAAYFSRWGGVAHVSLPRARAGPQPRALLGFAFIEFDEVACARAAARAHESSAPAGSRRAASSSSLGAREVEGGAGQEAPGEAEAGGAAPERRAYSPSGDRSGSEHRSGSAWSRRSGGSMAGEAAAGAGEGEGEGYSPSQPREPSSRATPRDEYSPSHSRAPSPRATPRDEYSPSNSRAPSPRATPRDEYSPSRSTHAPSSRGGVEEEEEAEGEERGEREREAAAQGGAGEPVGRRRRVAARRPWRERYAAVPPAASAAVAGGGPPPPAREGGGGEEAATEAHAARRAAKRARAASFDERFVDSDSEEEPPREEARGGRGGGQGGGVAGAGRQRGAGDAVAAGGGLERGAGDTRGGALAASAAGAAAAGVSLRADFPALAQGGRAAGAARAVAAAALGPPRAAALGPPRAPALGAPRAPALGAPRAPPGAPAASPEAPVLIVLLKAEWARLKEAAKAAMRGLRRAEAAAEVGWGGAGAAPAPGAPGAAAGAPPAGLLLRLAPIPLRVSFRHLRDLACVAGAPAYIDCPALHANGVADPRPLSAAVAAGRAGEAAFPSTPTAAAAGAAGTAGAAGAAPAGAAPADASATTTAIVRYKTPAAAQRALAYFRTSDVALGGVRISAEALVGEEESAYWRQVEAHKAAYKQGKLARRVQG